MLGRRRREGRGQQGSVEQQRAELRARITGAPFPAAGSWRVQFGFPKGGTGKSPATAAVSMLLAELRGEPVAAVDGDPRNSTLRRLMVPAEAPLPDPWLAGLPEIRADADSRRPGRPMVADPASLRRFSDLVGRVRLFTNLAAGQAQAEGMTGADYTDFIAWLSDGAQLVLTDLGNDKTSDLAIAQMRAADQLVACVKFQQDQIEGVVSWLSALCGQQVSYSSDPDSYAGMDDGQFGELARRAIIVIAPSGGDQTELAPLLDWLNNTTSLGRAPRPDGTPNGRLVIVPHDSHIAVGDVLSIDQLAAATEAAYLQVAALIAENWRLPTLSRRPGPPRPAGRRPISPQPATGLSAPPELAGGRVEQPGARAPVERGHARPGELLDRAVPAHPTGARPAVADVADVAEVAEVAGDYRHLIHSVGGQVVPLARDSRRPVDPRDITPSAHGAAPAPAPTGRTGPPAPTRSTPPAGGGQAAEVQDAGFVLGIDIGRQLQREHTPGEVCHGCPDPDCAWPAAGWMRP